MTTSQRPRNRVQKAFRPTADDLGRRVVNGAAFTFLGIGLRTAITVGSMAVLARVLTPADFGHIAMATVVTELAAVFANFGFGSILIQRLRISRIQIDTMHWSAVGLGAILTVLVFGLSFFASHFFQDEMVGPLLRILCLSFILDELTMVPRSLLARRMQFKLDFYVQSGILLARAGTAIVMALNSMGVWSLVGGALAGMIVQSCAYQALTGYWPRLKFSTLFLKSTWRTNGGYFGNGILFYVNANVDFLLVGRMLGATLLGQYQNARSLTDEIRVRMVQPVQRVLFPAFSAIQNDADRFRDGILRSGRLLALTFTPMGFGVAAVAPELVRVLYGEQWLPMIPILQVISIASGLGAAASIGSPIFNATNRVGLSFNLYFIQTLLAIAFMLFGSQWGLMGVVWSRLALAAVGLIFFRISLGLVNMRTPHIWQIMGSPCIAAGLMWWLLGMARGWVQTWVTSSAAQLGCLIGIGVAFYVATSLLISPQHVRDAKEVISKLRRKT
ncbi:MAG TPA: lipopolysaccharide biosynthesis protein [Polaromonas sp.]|nr:lipopolysaccharide biosynthesis protein [Polaromonas sp.]